MKTLRSTHIDLMGNDLILDGDEIKETLDDSQIGNKRRKRKKG